jgi:hypothetical protein
MSLQAVTANPFMLLVNPEAVFAAVEKSERLNGLNRHMCRPLDRVMPGSPEAANADSAAAAAAAELANDSEEFDAETAVTTAQSNGV